MATNKHAQIRYLALDKCFSNFNRRYYIGDLVKICNEAIYNYTGILDGVKLRQIYDDIIFMESEEGFSVPLERYKDGRKVYYRYADSNFSINSQPLNQNEIDQLKNTLIMLNRFKGMPHFDWMQEVMARFETSFGLNSNAENIVSFDYNIYLQGLEYFTELFNAILYKQVLEIHYHPAFVNTQTYIVHPYHLKQFNNRWFLIGINESNKYIMTLALDRIEGFSPFCKCTYIDNNIDFTEYFDDVIGVTIPKDKNVEDVLLKFDDLRLPYILSKPIHPTQKIKNAELGLIEISVIPNKELISLIMSFGKDVEVILPESLRLEIKENLEEINRKYNLCR